MRRSAVVLSAAVVAACARKVIADTFINPIAGSGADPWVTQFQGQYFYARSDGGQLFIQRSTKLTDIATGVNQSVFLPPGGTAYSMNLWAPELHYLDNKWYIYFAADDGTNANHR